MEYSNFDLLVYLLIYSFLGWVIEVGIIAIKDRRFCNRGFFNFPVCLSYGVIMDLLIVGLPTMGKNYLAQIVTIIAVTGAVNFLSGGLAKRISRNELWKYDSNNIFSGEIKGVAYTLVISAGICLGYYLIHPIIFITIQILPDLLVEIVTIVLAIAIVLDFFVILYVIHIQNKNEDIIAIQKKYRKSKIHISAWIYKRIWTRIQKAYPNMKKMEDAEQTKAYTFAKGICLDKVVWVFLICALGGDLIETLYCRLTAGIWMSRSSVIYGPFSLVWGIGAALLTIVLQKLVGKEDRYIFLAGAILGGVYEYMCSVFTEVFLGTTFWDYSWMPFNIGGRTNLLYCIFWGIIAVVWVKICYPKISGWIEKIPPLAGKIITWVLLVLMACDALISAMAMLRYTERAAGIEAENVVEVFLDEQYDDELIEAVWPNMVIQK